MSHESQREKQNIPRVRARETCHLNAMSDRSIDFAIWLIIPYMVAKYFFTFYFIKGMSQISKVLNVDIKMGYMTNFDATSDTE